MIFSKKCISMFLILFFLFSTIAISESKTNIINNEQTNIILYVGGNGNNNFSFIQDAIDSSSENFIIYVYNGTYHENLIINKSITLLAKNKQKVIIDGRRKSDVITINSEKVKIDGFTIINATKTGVSNFFCAGIRITKSNNIISNNTIIGNNVGIFIRRSKNEIIKDNVFSNNGIIISPYDIDESDIEIKKDFFEHTIENNKINGREIIYLKNQKNMVIPKNVGQLITFNCSNLIIDNISFTRCDYSLILAYTNNCLINKSYFIDDSDIWLMKSNNNIFKKNIMSKNLHGITIDYNSNNNIFNNNNFSNNEIMGIMIEDNSNNNIFEENNIFQNTKGAYIVNSYKNKWKHNYWDNWLGLKYKFLRFFPMIISGSIYGRQFYIPTLLNFDWSPSTIPIKT